jgi:hypothetical protein
MKRIRPTVADHKGLFIDLRTLFAHNDHAGPSSVPAVHFVVNVNPVATNRWLSVIACTPFIACATSKCCGSIAAILPIQFDIADVIRAVSPISNAS